MKWTFKFCYIVWNGYSWEFELLPRNFFNYLLDEDQIENINYGLGYNYHTLHGKDFWNKDTGVEEIGNEDIAGKDDVIEEDSADQDIFKKIKFKVSAVPVGSDRDE